MDTFVEQLVKKQKNGTQIAAMVLTVVAAVMLIAFAVFLFFLGFGILTFIAIAAIGYGTYYLLSSQNIEFEYCVTNGDIDIDRIVAQRKRERIVSVAGRKIESAGKYVPEKWTNRNIDRTVVAAPSLQADNLYCFTYHSKKRGHTLVIFQPNERVQHALYEGLPKLVQLDWDKE